MKRVPAVAVIILLSLVPMLPMAVNSGTLHTSDGAMHLARIAAYYKEVVAGQFPVRWASSLNYGFGTPIFDFFHPLPYLITTIFVALGSTLSWALRLSFIVSYVLSGVFAYLFAKELFRDKTAALTAAVLYQFAPFRLVDIIVRGSLGGVYSYTLLPLVFYAATAFVNRRRFAYLILLSVSTALLSISHNIVGFTFFGVALILTMTIAKTAKDRLLVAGAMFWGIAMSAWFVVPAIMEHKYTLGYLFTRNLYLQHFPPLQNLFIPNFTNDARLRVAEVSVQIGLVHVVGMLLSVWLIIRKKLPPALVPLFIAMLLGSIATIAFMQPITAKLWETIPLLSQFQYPWRLLAVITFTSGMLSVSYVLATRNPKLKTAIAIGISALAVVSTIAYWNPPEGYDRIDEASWWNYPLTTNYYGEVDTIWADGPAKAYAKTTAEPIEGTATVGTVSHQGVRYTYTVTAATDAAILQNTAYFPGWTVTVDGRRVPIEFQNQLYRGRITYRVPQGRHTVAVAYTQSGIQRISNAISVLAILLTAVLYFATRKRRA
jgi:hypothetical protein